MTTAQHLDAALEHLRAIGHAHTASALLRRHVEFAAGHLREARLDDDGQTARTPEQLHHVVASFYRFQSRLTDLSRNKSDKSA